MSQVPWEFHRRTSNLSQTVFSQKKMNRPKSSEMNEESVIDIVNKEIQYLKWSAEQFFPSCFEWPASSNIIKMEYPSLSDFCIHYSE